MWLKTAWGSNHTSVTYTWRIALSPTHLTPLTAWTQMKHSWRRPVLKIPMTQYPRAPSARHYCRRLSYILGLFLEIFSPSQARARANDPHPPPLNLETQRLKKPWHQSSLDTNQQNLKGNQRPSSFFRRPLNELALSGPNWWKLSLHCSITDFECYISNITMGTWWTWTSAALLAEQESEQETNTWLQLHRRISQNAFVELTRIVEEFSRVHPGLFKH